MQFSVDLSLEELMNLNIDVKGLIGGENGIGGRNFKFSTLARKRRTKKDQNNTRNNDGEAKDNESAN